MAGIEIKMAKARKLKKASTLFEGPESKFREMY